MKCAKPMWIAETSDAYGTYVPCGRCYACIQTKRSIWTFRLLQEQKGSITAYFITLTYDEKNVPLIQKNGYIQQTLIKQDLQNFFKALRSRINKTLPRDSQYLKKSEKTGKYSPKLRYFACGEYGGKTKRPHYHIILFNLPKKWVQKNPIDKAYYSPKLEQIWKKGNIDIGTVEQASIHYVTKYHMQPLTEGFHDSDPRQKPFALMSRKPGIGFNYVTDEIKNYYHNTKNSFVTLEKGIKQPLGRYYKDKIYGETQLRKEVQNKVQQFTEKMDKIARNPHKSELDFIRAQQRQYEINTKKAKHLLNKNNKL